MGGLIVDNFAGGGGASLAIEWALGRSPDIAINHDPKALQMHRANHPETEHFCQNIYQVDPADIRKRGPIALAWFSPDCTHHSRAKGGVPLKRHIRDLAWVVVLWAQRAQPAVICLENVAEFRDWGPLLEDGRPCPVQRGLTFRRWVKGLKKLGYRVEWRELAACDYGAPTIRKRLFVVARCDGQPIVWPAPTHGPGLAPYRTAAEIIDWSIPCPSIFERKRPLAEATQARIARGIRRFVLDSPDPFIVPVTHPGDTRVHPIDEPLRTITAAHRGELALVAPSVVRVAHGERCKNGRKRGRGEHSLEEPLGTVVGSNEFGLLAPTLIQTGYGERAGQAPRSLDLDRPLGTVVAGGQKHALVAAFMAQHNGNHVTGRQMGQPVSTITSRGTQQALVTSHLFVMRQHQDGRDHRRPVPTICAGGQRGGVHFGEVRAFLMKYYGTGGGQDPRDPLHTVLSKDRFGVVTIEGTDYEIADIGMRMLTPRELFRAQGFPDSYVIDPEFEGKPLTKTAQIACCGNSVSPYPAAALLRANLPAEIWAQQDATATAAATTGALL